MVSVLSAIVRVWAFAAICIAGSMALQAAQEGADDASSGYEEMLVLYQEFRAFVPPKVVDGVSDYSARAMAAQYAELQNYIHRLRAIDDTSWPVSQRVDYMIVLAEMRAMDFQHRVIEPWKKDPAFYSVTNLGFGPKAHGVFAVPQLPMTRDEAEYLLTKLETVPRMLTEARKNLTDARGDLARLAIAQKKIERNVFRHLANDTQGTHPLVSVAARGAQAAVEEFLAWLESVEADLPAHAGIGKENYDWYLRHVLLFPYTWDEMYTLAEREYQRSVAFLKMEEHRHRGIPMPEPVSTRAAFDKQRAEADTDLLRFLADENILTVPDYLVTDPNEGPYILPADRDPDLPGLFEPPIKRHFFFEAEHRDPRPLRAHNVPGHLFDALLHQRDNRPVRGQKRLFFVDGIRAEGWAFYLEELIQQTGFLSDRPKAREINYILQTKRAARVIPELRMHANSWVYKDAFEHLVSHTPYWMGPDDAIAKFDIELYLRQPGYGIGYYIGKLELEKLLAERAVQQGSDFNLKQFHDSFLAAGRIPISLIRWEMTGYDDEIELMR